MDTYNAHHIHWDMYVATLMQVHLQLNMKLDMYNVHHIHMQSNV